MKLKTRYCALKIDTPTSNGITWPRAVVEKALIAFNQEIAAGKAFGTHCEHADSALVPLSLVSHILRAAYIEGDRLLVEVETLDTAEGLRLQKAVATHGELGVRFSFVGIGSLDRKDAVEPNLLFTQFPWRHENPAHVDNA